MLDILKSFNDIKTRSLRQSIQKFELELKKIRNPLSDSKSNDKNIQTLLASTTTPHIPVS